MATPIGNHLDISQRAKDILSTVEFILCEDTRQTKKLLTSLSILKNQKLYCANEHKEIHQLKFLKEKISQNIPVAYVSDAGTPGISDPGNILVDFCHKNQLKVIPIPGASALTTFISAIGARTQSFSFLGFLPRKDSDIKILFENLQQNECFVFFLESPHRIETSISLLHEILPLDTLIYIGRELTKIYEQIWTGTLEDLKPALEKDIVIKGEFIVGIEIQKKVTDHWKKAALSLVSHFGVKQTSLWICEYFDIPKNQVYDFLTNIAKNNTISTDAK